MVDDSGRGETKDPAASGDEGLTAPTLTTGPISLLRGGIYRLRLSAAASSPATLVATVTQSRGYIAGVPVWLILFIAAAVYMGATASTARGRWSKPAVSTTGHERY